MHSESSSTAAPAIAGFADAMRERTRQLHARAERSGVIRAVLQGTAHPLAYALLLRNLLPAYRALELGLERNAAALGELAQPDIFRATRIEHDLAVLCGPAWRGLALLPAGARYAARVAIVAAHSEARLSAHAYGRLLGDLNGGQLMRNTLARGLRLPTAALSFYEFPGSAEPAGLRRRYRAAFDRLDLSAESRERALAEAELAFELNIAVSESVARAVPPKA